MSETNGQDKSRLDRIEEMIERSEKRIELQVLANEAAHDNFRAEHKTLLTAQILMNGALQKMAEGMTSLESKMETMAEGMVSLELKMEETTGKLNALIDTVDGIIRNKP